MILKPRYVHRFRHVAAVLIRHGFADVLVSLDLRRFLPGHAPSHTPDEKTQIRARSLRTAFEELGPAYVKLGQLLSTRPDILPEAYTDELERLQDRVAPFAFAEVKLTLEGELGGPLADSFATFEETPLASASLSQVHRATLAHDTAEFAAGDAVAVKVLRPGLEEGVELDLEILLEVAHFVGRSAAGRRYDFTGVVEQLERTLRDELDLKREARNARHFAEAYRSYPRLRVPRVVRELTTRRVYTAEFIAATRFPDLAPDHTAPAVADELWRAYLQQILVEGFFQCDPHPGNFLLDDEGRLVLLDHGMVAHLPRESQLQLLALLCALGDRDGERAADACIEIGTPGPEFREKWLKSELSLLVARSSGVPLAELGVGKLVLDVVVTAFRADIQIPPELTLLGKTLLNLESVCRRLDPAMDPIATMRAMAAELMSRQILKEFSKQKMLAATLEARSLATQLPRSLRRLVRRAAENDLRIGLKLEGEEQIQAGIQKIAGGVTLGLITAALILGSALMLNVKAGPMVWGYPAFALVGFIFSAVLGVYLMVKIILIDRY